MKKAIIIISMLLLSLGELFAQLNESDTIRFQLRASFSGNYQQGNVEFLALRGKVDLVYAPVRKWVFKTQNNSLYQAFFSQKADNDIFSRNFLYFSPSSRIYPFAIAYVSSNFRRKINHRYFAGAGVTWQAVYTKNHVLKFSASTVYEATKFNTDTYNYAEYNGNRNINLCRGTLYLAGQHELFERHIRLYYDAYWQPAFDNRNNYRTQADFGMDFPVWKGISMSVFYTFTHEHVVAQNIRQEDKILSFGIAYNLRRI